MWTFFDYFFPKFCLGCNAVGETVCVACGAEIQLNELEQDYDGLAVLSFFEYENKGEQFV